MTDQVLLIQYEGATAEGRAEIRSGSDGEGYAQHPPTRQLPIVAIHGFVYRSPLQSATSEKRKSSSVRCEQPCGRRRGVTK